MDAGKQSRKIDKLAVTGLVLGLVSLFGALIIAALSFGGVIAMGTVAICLILASVVGIAGIIVGAFWLKPWLREGLRVAAGMLACPALLFGIYSLYGWTERNGHRPTEVAITPPSRSSISNATTTAAPKSLLPQPQLTPPEARPVLPRSAKPNDSDRSHIMSDAGGAVGRRRQPPDSPKLAGKRDPSPSSPFQDCKQSICIGGDNSGSPTVNNGPLPVNIEHIQLLRNQAQIRPDGAVTYKSTIRITLSGLVPELTVKASAPSLLKLDLDKENAQIMTAITTDVKDGTSMTSIQNASGNNIVTVITASPEPAPHVWFGCHTVTCTLSGESH